MTDSKTLHATTTADGLVERLQRLQRFHCVTQLQRDSWEYRIKQPGEARNCDDLVSLDDVLAALASCSAAPQEPAENANLREALRVARRWIVEGGPELGWTIDRLDEAAAPQEPSKPQKPVDLMECLRKALDSAPGPNKRYCGMCDKWVAARETECRACGGATDKAEAGEGAAPQERNER